MNTTIAIQFAKYYPNFSDCVIQIFDDVETRKDPSLAKQAMKWNDDTMKVCEQSNANGCGIFFSINPVEGTRRLQSNIKTINTRVVEIDNISKEEQKKLLKLAPLQPSCVVESKRSYHFYWWAENGTKENWRKIMRGLRNFFNGDHKIITEERVMRLPGFDHSKTLDDKFETKYYEMTNRKYTEDEMLLAYPDIIDKKEQTKQLKTFKTSDDFRTRACSVNSEYMLSLLSGSKRVNGEIIEVKGGQIFINGKSTSSRIDKAGKIGSHDNGGPTRTQWIAWYGSVDRKELYQWTIEKLPELQEKKQEKKQTKELVNDDILKEYNRNHKTDYQKIVPFTFGNKSLDEYFGRIDRGRFITTLGESGSGKTTRVFHQGIEISKQYKVLFISLEMTGERVVELRARKKAGITHQERDDKQIPPEKIQYMEKHKREITENKNLTIVGVAMGTGKVTADAVLASIQKKYMDHDWIIIDNLGFISDEGQNEREELNNIIRKFKDFCHDNHKNINLIHHFTKGNSKSRQSMDRTFADVLGTGKLENDIDYGIFISRYLDKREDLSEMQKQEVFIKVAKDRDHGEIKTKAVYFKKGQYYDDYQNIF